MESSEISSVNRINPDEQYDCPQPESQEHVLQTEPVQAAPAAEPQPAKREVPKANWMCRCHPGERNFAIILEKLQEFAATKCAFMCIGPMENCKWEKLPGGLGFHKRNPVITTENHIHFCFRLLTKTRFSALKRALEFCTPNIEEERFGMQQCYVYCVKSGPALFKHGEVLSVQEKARRGQLQKEQADQNRVKDNLKMCFDKYKTVREFKIGAPQIYARNSQGINSVYAERIREIPIDKPRIDWYFGKTRSGKTYQAELDVGGKTNPDVYYANGTVHWYSNYAGQSTIIFNEYRKSSLQDFCNLLSVLEGWPADQECKGGFVPIRAKHIIITCPRPPEALEVNGEIYRGEFESQDRYGPEHLNQAWEDVKQVTERIRESGGTITCFQKFVVCGVTNYMKTDVTNEPNVQINERQ